MLIEFDESLRKAFDRKEGHPYFYSRGENRVPVTRLRDGQTTLAWLYLAKPNRGNSRNLRPTRDYKRIVIEAAEFWGFPPDYIEKIKSWPTL